MAFSTTYCSAASGSPNIKAGSSFGALLYVKRAEIPQTRLGNSRTLLPRRNTLFTSRQVEFHEEYFVRRTILRGEMRPLYHPARPPDFG